MKEREEAEERSQKIGETSRLNIDKNLSLVLSAFVSPLWLGRGLQLSWGVKTLGKSGCIEVCSIDYQNLGYTVLSEVKASRN